MRFKNLKGYPKAPELIQKNRARKKKSIIATDTPELNEIKAKSKERVRQAELKMRKKQGKLNDVKTRVFKESSSEESDRESYQEETRGSSEDASDIEDAFDKDNFLAMERQPIAGDYVLVQFDELKTVIFCVGKILNKKEDEFEISFLRKSNKSNNCFFHPVTEDISMIEEKTSK